jgi:hypothetical protein
MKHFFFKVAEYVYFVKRYDACKILSLQEVIQSARTIYNEAKFTSSNLSPPSYADMLKIN